jgi:hypothetical protein
MKIFKYLGFATIIIFAVACSVCCPALIWLLINYDTISGLFITPMILLLPPIGWLTCYSMWDSLKDDK